MALCWTISFHRMKIVACLLWAAGMRWPVSKCAKVKRHNKYSKITQNHLISSCVCLFSRSNIKAMDWHSVEIQSMWICSIVNCWRCDQTVIWSDCDGIGWRARADRANKSINHRIRSRWSNSYQHFSCSWPEFCWLHYFCYSNISISNISVNVWRNQIVAGAAHWFHFQWVHRTGNVLSIPVVNKLLVLKHFRKIIDI